MKAAVINDPVDGFVTVKDVQLRDLKPGEALVVTLIYTLLLETLVRSPVVLSVMMGLAVYLRLPLGLLH